MPSERCNLKCRYCYETAKNPQRIDFDVAVAAIAKAFSQLPAGKKLKIEFRGGEPFLEFPIIKKICSWVLENYKRNDYSFYAVSNGTCFTEEVKQWLTEHKDLFFVPLSIDGDKTTQDANRSNSFDRIDFPFIFETWDQPLTYTTVIPENVDRIFEDFLFLMQKKFTIRANFEFASNWSENQLERLSVGLKTLADYVAENNVCVPECAKETSKLLGSRVRR